ncbi:MAG: hypothetical protein OEW15_05120 [Nitrospirota bacterium]|nr:hypothetical protein [Nitrospirota bacterium]
MAKQGAYFGASAGLTIFGLFGLMPSCLLGGAMGLTIAGMISSIPVEPGILARMIVLVSMLAGAVVFGILIVTAAACLGGIIGSIVAPRPPDRLTP